MRMRFLTGGRQSRALSLIGRTAGLAVIALAVVASATAGSAQVPPPPPSIGAVVPLSYFGPMPSSVMKELVGPVHLLRAGKINKGGTRITLPLYLGHNRDGKNVWYILTDTTDKANSESLGLNFSGKLAYANVGRAAREATLLKNASLVFDAGGVDFSPARKVVPGPAAKPFPPRIGQPGATGDAEYSPLVRIINQPGTPIYNAPIVAFDVDAKEINFCKRPPNYGLVHDRVIRICPRGNGGGTVTLETTPVFSFAKPSLYISTDASDPVVAALDKGIFAPALADIPVGRDDSAFSALERLFPIANGPTGRDNPQRQGLASALTDKDKKGKPLPPLQVIGGIPTVALDYSPLWDLQLAEWTPGAIRKGYRARIIDEFELLTLVAGGWVTGPGGKKFGSTGIIVNCPIVLRFL